MGALVRRVATGLRYPIVNTHRQGAIGITVLTSEGTTRIVPSVSIINLSK